MRTPLEIEIDSGRATRIARFADRWIWVFMAVLFIATALAGFIPRSLHRIQLIQAGEQAPFAVVTHVHAATMALWFSLLLLQTILVATGRRLWHQRTGRVAIVVGLAVPASLVAITVHGVTSQLTTLTLPQLSDQFAFAIFVQGKAIILFSVYLWIALRKRISDPQLHKRLIVLANFAIIAAAFDRIPWLQHFGLEWPYYEDLWNVLILSPILLYDALRSRQWIWVWLLGIAVLVPFVAAYYYLGVGLPDWWQAVVARLFGLS
jgi:hypothetical protein